jgi:DNA-3-methyladenine glycosylase
MTIESLSQMPVCLGHSFYERDTAEVARSLLGKVFARKLAVPGGILWLAGYIIETEAYGYLDDPASHAFNGIRPRNSVMFGNVGCLYVYLIYGKHFCANVTARKRDSKAGAVLIRSILPYAGQGIMTRMRGNSKNLAFGPGRITQAMSITLAHNGLDVTQKESLITIHHGQQVDGFVTSKRIGISRAIDRPWRYSATKFTTDLKIKSLPR